MNIKRLFATFISFSAVLLFSYTAKSQAVSDTIRIKEISSTIRYYYVGNNQVKLNFLMDVTKENEISNKLMQQAYNLHLLSTGLCVVGGLTVGFAFGYLILPGITNSIKNEVLYSSFGAGVGLLICGGVCELASRNKILKGVRIYNKSMQNNAAASFDIGISPTGMTLKLNF